MTFGEAESNLILDKLVDRWAVASDQKQVDEQMSLMTWDATYRVYNGNELHLEAHGQDDLKKALTEQAKAIKTSFTLTGQHLVTMDRDSNTATGVQYAQVRVVREADNGAFITDYSVRYNDHYAFRGENWAIEQRDVHLVIVDAHKLA
ncbi:MAG TPA: nuclear transport factor 2 family protein [Candidatus Levilactobacillus faecigallinarum]|uniref:Nuclear transport factor 2 family protein n=1 Tax=Candidatus Levilactobacillus faecigallinarum TaxID=2838638 RepID=A0A9D1QS63_9LACO|nr:nuclear transport factor 2 family protein [Candidatus Levilactobacillus faecigallinarum]